MTLFALLLALALERLFKMGEHWRFDRLFEACFNRIKTTSLAATLLLLIVWLALFLFSFWLVHGLFFGLITLLLSIAIAWFCIGAGVTRQHYRDYLKAAKNGDTQATDYMANELALIHGLPDEGDEARLRELQNALLWINFRYYLSPLLWFIALGPVALGCYALMRSYQTWLARRNDPVARKKSGIDLILFWLDWIPTRLVGIAYTLLGNGDKALPCWIASLTDIKTPQYQVLTDLAQLALERSPHTDPVATPIAAVSLAKKVTIAVLVVVAILTIYGTFV